MNRAETHSIERVGDRAHQAADIGFELQHIGGRKTESRAAQQCRGHDGEIVGAERFESVADVGQRFKAEAVLDFGERPERQPHDETLGPGKKLALAACFVGHVWCSFLWLIERKKTPSPFVGR